MVWLVIVVLFTGCMSTGCVAVIGSDEVTINVAGVGNTVEEERDQSVTEVQNDEDDPDKNNEK